MLFTEPNLAATLQAIGVDKPGDLFGDLDRAYGEPARFYHNHQHIDACLCELRSVPEDQLLHRHEIEMAIWFHDAIYDSRRHDNEEQSAAWATRVLHSHAVDPSVTDRVEALIMITTSHREPQSNDEAIMIDIDLSIFGQDERTFAAYDDAIRREYAWLEDEDYRAGRRTVLVDFLTRCEQGCLFQSSLFRDRYEARAAANLRRAVTACTGPPSV